MHSWLKDHEAYSCHATDKVHGIVESKLPVRLQLHRQADAQPHNRRDGEAHDEQSRQYHDAFLREMVAARLVGAVRDAYPQQRVARHQVSSELLDEPMVGAALCSPV